MLQEVTLINLLFVYMVVFFLISLLKNHSLATFPTLFIKLNPSRTHTAQKQRETWGSLVSFNIRKKKISTYLYIECMYLT